MSRYDFFMCALLFLQNPQGVQETKSTDNTKPLVHSTAIASDPDKVPQSPYEAKWASSYVRFDPQLNEYSWINGAYCT